MKEGVFFRVFHVIWLFCLNYCKSLCTKNKTYVDSNQTTSDNLRNKVIVQNLNLEKQAKETDYGLHMLAWVQFLWRSTSAFTIIKPI